jgi:tetratricopeptide (TPR) repeat protein
MRHPCYKLFILLTVGIPTRPVSEARHNAEPLATKGERCEGSAPLLPRYTDSQNETRTTLVPNIPLHRSFARIAFLTQQTKMWRFMVTGTALKKYDQPELAFGLTVKPDPHRDPERRTRKRLPKVSFAIHKSLPADWIEDPNKRETMWIEMLTRPLTHGTLVAFLGSGCSRAFGLPDWLRLAKTIAECAKEKFPEANAAPDLPSLIGRYKRVLRDSEKYWQALGKALSSSIKAPDENPYRALLDLRIHRFVTSNYDDLLEQALRASGREFDESTDSFGPDRVAKLCEFVTADPASHRDMIFHCHGQLRGNPGRVESLIVTEEDYQEQYFGRGEDKMAFRQALELLYGSNPILFIGTSLNDEDLFRPLRAFGATHRSRRPEQLLFALVDECDEYRIESLYVRYGVKVITYKRGADPNSGAGLAQALKELHQHWTYYRESWLRTPSRRKIPDRKGNVVRYPGQETDSRVKHDSPDLRRVQDLLSKKDTRVLCLLGPGGAGKSWLANQLLDTRRAHAKSKSFFWSSYYSGDYLSGLDRALAFFEADTAGRKPVAGRPSGVNEAESRLDRLARCLKEGRHFLVLDGLERVLRESDKEPDTGVPLNPDIRRFFKAIGSKHRSKIILTSRLWPQTLDEPPLKKAAVRYHLSAATVEEAKRSRWLQSLTDVASAPAIFRLLEGHRYALTLANVWLQVRSKEVKAKRKPDEVATELQLLLAQTSPEHRVSRMIELVVKQLEPFEQKLLDHLSVCMGAIPAVVVDKCKELACPDGLAKASSAVGDPLQTLEERHLLFCLQDGQDNGHHEKTKLRCIHPIVRGYVFHRRHHASSDELPNFTLPGFTAGGSQVDPGGPKSAEEILRILQQFQEAGRYHLTKTPRDPRAALDFCRNAFGIIRSRMEANTSSRWDRDQSGEFQNCPGEKYLRALVQLGDFVREVSLQYLSSTHGPVEKVDDAPLWDDELAWLYNEIGLTYYHKGAVLDAFGVWQLEHEINGLIDSNSSGGLYLFQSSCNLGAAFIQLGRLHQAEVHFRNAERINLRVDDEDHKARIWGYRGLIEHLRGNLQAAQKLYEKAMFALENVAFNQRGWSIFQRHYADLLLKLKETKPAEHQIVSGRARAEAAHYPDIVAHYRLSAGHMHRQRRKIDEAMRNYLAALEEAREMGLRGLEADALSELSHLALDVGDTQTAIDRAIEALQIANELSLGLRKTHGLLVLGLALIGSKKNHLGAAYLRHAKGLAEGQGYWLLAREADEQLRKLGSELSRTSIAASGASA